MEAAWLADDAPRGRVNLDRGCGDPRGCEAIYLQQRRARTVLDQMVEATRATLRRDAHFSDEKAVVASDFLPFLSQR